MKVCLDVRFLDGRYGGVQEAAAGLVGELARTETDVDLALLAYRGHLGWLPAEARRLEIAEVAPPRVPAPRKVPAWVRNNAPALRTPAVPASDGTIERLGADLVHFTFQNGFLTDVPSIYQPWDLQHVHLPHFFSRRERALRDRWYRGLAEQASAVVVATEWARRDLVDHLGVAPDQIEVIPAGPGSFVDRSPDETAVARAHARLGSDLPFALYPAATHPHKNHLRLIDAVASLGRRGTGVRVVCVGNETAHVAALRRRVRDLGLEDAVLLLGHVDEGLLRALYGLARCLVFPSLFEGWGLPLVEAFAVGLPVACSTATSLPETAADAAVFFDPREPDEIAAAIDSVWNDAALRDGLVERGRARAALYTWEAAARRFVELYARLAPRQDVPKG